MSTSDPGGGDDVSSHPSSQAGSKVSSSQRSLRKSPPTSKEEALRLASGSINRLSGAKAHLVSKGYLIQGGEISLLGLSLILFQIAAEAKLPALADSIKAVAFLLEVLGVDSISERVASSIDAKLTGLLVSLESSVASLEAKDEELGDSAQAIANAAIQIVEATDDSSRSINDAADRLRNHLDKRALDTSSAVNSQTSPLSYAAAVARPRIPLAHASAISRYEERARQIIIQPSSDALEGFRQLTELELVAKAMLAYESVTQTDKPAPQGFRFVGAKKLASGSVTLDLNSAEAATWLKDKDIQLLFMQNFGAMSVLKEHEFRALAEFVPVSFAPDALAAIERIEQDSGAPVGGLVKVEWAKLPERRHALQRLAHLKLFFKSAEAANYAIRNGLYIAGKKVGVRKMTQEARRCSKCQRYGHGNNAGSPHFAKDCKWLHDTCGGCGQHHRKEDCTVDLSVDSFCVNCNKKGHTVWDRNCPVFIERCKRLEASNQENWYPLFVTHDASTWETNTLDADPQMVEDEDDWTPTTRKGTSGRGGRNFNQRSVNPVQVNRNGGQSRGSGPATSTNRTALGTQSRYRQLTFEETAQRAGAHRSGEDGLPEQAGKRAAAPSQSQAPTTSNSNSSWFNDIPLDLCMPNSAPPVPHSQPSSSSVPS